MISATILRRACLAALTAALLLVGPGCVHPGKLPRTFSYFVPPTEADPWSPKIEAWQSRERAEPAAPTPAGAAVSEAGDGAAAAGAEPEPDLRAKYLAYRQAQKRAMARELAAWIQREAKRHYRPDGPIDHWATLEETLERDGDDCDGLELLVYHSLRDLGFADHEVYRAIVRRPSDGQHHMVTLWFEDPNDPWVLDPTGAMTSGMPRMSDVPEWEPLKVFSETEEFTALPRRLAAPAP